MTRRGQGRWRRRPPSARSLPEEAVSWVLVKLYLCPVTFKYHGDFMAGGGDVPGSLAAVVARRPRSGAGGWKAATLHVPALTDAPVDC